MVPGLEPAELPADAIEVGRIADAWGIKGWFKVLPHSASPEALFSSKRWYLQPSERGAKTFNGTVLLSIKVDLIGLPVVNREGVALGEIKDLLSTGPQTVLVLEYPKDDGGEPGRAGERMIPFVSAYVDQVDVPGRRILVDWQPDY